MRPSLRTIAALGLAAMLVSSSGAAGPPPAAPPKKAVWRVLSGEIIDMGCYTARGFKGPAHRDCGTQCVRNGVPKGLLTVGDTVYVLTQHHDRAMAPANFPPPDPFVLCANWVSQQVEISGLVWEGKGSRFLEVRGAKLAPPAAAAP